MIKLLKPLFASLQRPQSWIQASTPTKIQPKLTIGQPGDKYEQEADRVADQVMAMPTHTAQQQLQPQIMDEEEPVQTKSLAATPAVQLQTTEEEEQVQTKSLVATPVQTLCSLFAFPHCSRQLAL